MRCDACVRYLEGAIVGRGHHLALLVVVLADELHALRKHVVHIEPEFGAKSLPELLRHLQWLVCVQFQIASAAQQQDIQLKSSRNKTIQKSRTCEAWAV